jgi:antirestriction protein ArdC
MVTTDNAKKLLAELVEQLDAHTIAKFCQKKRFTRGSDVPMQKWSTLNQFACFYLGGTSDARGYDQWRKVGRWPCKGSHAVYILAPMFRTVTTSKTDASKEPTEAEEEIKILTGFRCVPVYRVEDTEGKPLDYRLELQAFDPSAFPLYSVAVAMGVKVQAGLTGRFNGYFEPGTNTITLGTDDPTTFMHELTHAIDAQLPGQSEDKSYNEVVAELSSCFLCTLYNLPTHEQYTKAYIQSYSEAMPVALKIASAVDRVLQIYAYIESFGAADQQQAAQ